MRNPREQADYLSQKLSLLVHRTSIPSATDIPFG
jgi:hypothetical protein